VSDDERFVAIDRRAARMDFCLAYLAYPCVTYPICVRSDVLEALCDRPYLTSFASPPPPLPLFAPSIARSTERRSSAPLETAARSSLSTTSSSRCSRGTSRPTFSSSCRLERYAIAAIPLASNRVTSRPPPSLPPHLPRPCSSRGYIPR